MGDPVALVVAVDRYVAEDAVDLVDVDYEPLPPVVDYVTAQEQRGARARRRTRATSPARSGPPLSEALADVFESAAHDVRVTIYQQAYAPVPMETRGMVAEWSGEELTVWAATQAPHEVRMFLARLLGIGEHQVRVIMRDTGGGFGQKVLPLREDMCIALAAMKLAAPAEVDRGPAGEPDRGRACHATSTATAAWRFDDEGRIVAAHIDHVQDIGAYPTPWPVGTAAAVGMLFPGPYRVPSAGFRTTSVFSNTSGRTAYRGPWQFESLAREVLLDIAARRMGIDPVELRRRNLLRQRRAAAARTRTACPTATSRPSETFEQALAILDYDGFRREQAEARAVGPLPRRRDVRPTSNRPPPAWPFYGHRGGDDPHRAVRQGERLRRRWLDAATASRPPSSSSPPMRSASTSPTSARSRATPR